MQRSDGECGSDTTSNGAVAVDRRSYLKLAGVTAGSVPLLSGAASAAFERRGIRFRNTVDMVADAGCDPTGREPCDERIEDAADDYTLLKFPEGEYKITEKNVIFDKTNLGFLGVGDVRFTVPEEFNDKVLVVDRGTGLLFENIDIDQRADGATPGLKLCADDDLKVHDVEYIGQGIHPDSDPRGEGGGNPTVTGAFFPVVRTTDGTGVVSNFVAKNAGLMGTYNRGNGRLGVFVGISTVGTITFRDCHIEGFPNNAMYCSRTNGVVEVEGGVFRNNDVSQIRIGSEGSYVEGAIMSVDAGTSESPNPWDALNQRGVRFEGARIENDGPAVRDCDIRIGPTPNSNGGIVATNTCGDFVVENTRIGVEKNDAPSVLAKPPTGTSHHDPPPKPHDVTVRDVSFTGRTNSTAIKLYQRPSSVIDGCCIQQPNSDNGVSLIDSDGCVVRDSTISVTEDPVIKEGSRNVSISDIAAGGSCPAPNYGAGDSLPRKLTFESDGGEFSYRFSVSGELGKSTAMGASLDDKDAVSGRAASGLGEGGTDSYGFSGDILGFELDGDATVYLDGERVNPAQFPANTLTIASNGGRFSYVLGVEDDLEKSTALGASIDSNDYTAGNMTAGQGEGGTDSYSFSGDILAFELDGDATPYLNGDRIDASRYPDPDILTIEGTGSRATYAFSTPDGLVKSTANGANINGNDEIEGSTASGVVGAAVDSYAFVGELVSLVLDGDANVFLNSDRIDPDEYPDHVLTIEGTGPRATYSFAVSEGLQKSEVGGANLNGNDEITNGHRATGVVGASADAYTFDGDLLAFDHDGPMHVLLDGEPAHIGNRPDHVLTIEGTGPRATYSFAVSEGLQKSEVGGANLNGNDQITNSRHATGVVGASADAYTFDGDLLAFDHDGPMYVLLDGEPAHIGNRPDHVLTIEGTGSRATYRFSVTGALEKSTANGASLNGNDEIRGSGASGVVGIASDSYTFSGNLGSFSIDGDANVFLDGRRTRLG